MVLRKHFSLAVHQNSTKSLLFLTRRDTPPSPWVSEIPLRLHGFGEFLHSLSVSLPPSVQGKHHSHSYKDAVFGIED